MKQLRSEMKQVKEMLELFVNVMTKLLPLAISPEFLQQCQRLGINTASLASSQPASSQPVQPAASLPSSSSSSPAAVPSSASASAAPSSSVSASAAPSSVPASQAPAEEPFQQDTTSQRRRKRKKRTEAANNNNSNLSNNNNSSSSNDDAKVPTSSLHALPAPKPLSYEHRRKTAITSLKPVWKQLLLSIQVDDERVPGTLANWVVDGWTSQSAVAKESMKDEGSLFTFFLGVTKQQYKSVHAKLTHKHLKRALSECRVKLLPVLSSLD
jgi:hypothetical protein